MVLVEGPTPSNCSFTFLEMAAILTNHPSLLLFRWHTKQWHAYGPLKHVSVPFFPLCTLCLFTPFSLYCFGFGAGTFTFELMLASVVDVEEIFSVTLIIAVISVLRGPA